MSDVEEYYWRLGDWSLSFLLETWRKPTYHASVAVLDVPYKFDSVLKLDRPRPHMLWTKDWDPDHKAQAKFLLAKIMGPLLRPADRQQRVLETIGAVAWHWHMRRDRPVE